MNLSKKEIKSLLSEIAGVEIEAGNDKHKTKVQSVDTMEKTVSISIPLSFWDDCKQKIKQKAIEKGFNAFFDCKARGSFDYSRTIFFKEVEAEG